MDGDEFCFSTGKSAQEMNLSHVPTCYKVEPSQRPSPNPSDANVPIVDLAGLHGSARSLVVQAIRQACLRIGFFQVVNHGIPQVVLDGALGAAIGFFELPVEERMEYMSTDVQKPVRYGTSLKDGDDKVQFWRIFLKHYAHSLEDSIHSWPRNPSNYRDDMSKYTKGIRRLALELTEVITESLGLGPTYLSHKMAQGMQVMALNCYSPCPEPELALGLPPHSDYSCFTILLQSSQGLEIMDPMDRQWKMVPHLHGALQVHVGDHVEVLSNGIYKSVVHRATLNAERTRISIASLHSLDREEKVGPADELVDDSRRPRGYRESSFQDFMEFLSANDVASQGKSFLDTLTV